MKRKMTKSILPLLLLSSMALAGCSGKKNSSLPNASSSPASSPEPSASPSSPSESSSPLSSPSTPVTSSSSSSSSQPKEVVLTLAADKSVLKLDETLALHAEVLNTENKAVSWSSSDEAILTVSDGVVTAVGIGTAEITATSVADSTKSATVSLTAVDKYDVRITQNGTVTAEVENLDLSGFVIRSDVASMKPTAQACLESSDEATYGTSGGKSIGFIGKGTVLTVHFYLASSAKVTPIARMATVDATFDVDANLEFQVDSTSVTSKGYTAFGPSGRNQYWNWKDVELDALLLGSGEHTFTYTAKNSGINLDAFKFKTEEYGATDKYLSISANGTYTKEAEDVMNQDDANFIPRSEKPDAASCVESSDEATYGTSGGKSVGFIGKGTTLNVDFYLGDDAVVTPIARMADAGDTFDVDANLGFSLDGTALTSGGYKTFGSADNNQYWNWKDVALTATILKRGFHTFTYTVKEAAINLDAFKLNVSYYGDLSSYGYQITEDGTTTIEAEDITLTQGTWQVESPTGEAASLTSGGKSIGNVSANASFSIWFNLGKPALVDLTAVMAKYEDNYSLNGNVIATLDGETLTPAAVTFGHTDTNQYWNWKNVTFYSDILSAGTHTLIVSSGTVDNAFPNTDCFKITARGYGEAKGFVVEAAKTVRKEGEEIDTSHLISDGGSSFVEASTEAVANTSGKKCLCHMNPGSYFEVPFYMTEDFTMDVTCRLAKYESLNVSENYSCYLDGTKVDWTDTTLTLGRTDGNDFHNWKLATLKSSSLTAGAHVFKFCFDKAGVNLDYVEFAFSSAK